MLVVAFALAGRVDIDLSQEPLGTGTRRRAGLPAGHLADARRRSRRRWPARSSRSCSSGATRSVFEGDETWQALKVPEGSRYAWDPDSTYVQEPPFFVDLPPEPPPLRDITGARVLAVLGDSVTTDHISPAGLDPEERSRRPVPAGARRGAGGLEHLRLPPRQPRGDDARHLRQRAHQQRAGAGQGGELDPPLPHRRGDVDLRRRHALPGRRNPARGPDRQGVRHRVEPRLGGQGPRPARREGRHRGELRADPPEQPGGDGRAARWRTSRAPTARRSASPAGDVLHLRHREGARPRADA